MNELPRELPSASLIEGLRFTATVGLPNVVQGLFRRRRIPVAIAGRLGIDGGVVGLMRGLRRSHAPGPVWIRVGKDPALLLLSPRDVRRVLAESPQHFASDPEPKRKGMAHFQPQALTISRGGQWRERREFTESVLETGSRCHSLSDGFARAIDAEAAALLARVEAAGEDGDGEITWERWHECVSRIARTIIFGSAARDDAELSERMARLMDEANSMPSGTSDELELFIDAIRGYVAAAEPGSLAALAAKAPRGPATDPPHQLVHWFFALQDTLAINALRALALLGSHPAELARAQAEIEGAELTSGEAICGLHHLEACLEEAMRLWPTTQMLARETVAETEFGGASVPAGTQVLIVNTYHHRDPDSVAFADRFAPKEWTRGAAAENWSFNHFSHGPQGCPGANVALFAGVALLAGILRRGSPRLRTPELDSNRPLPHSLDFFAIRVGLEPSSALR